MPHDGHSEAAMTTHGFDPLALPESNATSYFEPFRADNQRRWFRRLGEGAGLRNFAVNLTLIVPGGQPSARHARSRQDEFVCVLDGEMVLETTTGSETLHAGMCAAFAAGTGIAHRSVNPAAQDALLLVVGDRSADDEVSYPDLDPPARLGENGRYRFARKDGTPY
jgi:uncharacterized cupin superfamily protein